MAPALPSLGRWRAGNTGIAGVWTFAADTPGPHVMVNALTHGNEPGDPFRAGRVGEV